MEISFNPEWFNSGYFVYVIIINHTDKGTYYYVGQTGDRKHQSARSPFYRMMGHYNTYNLGSGTDSQLIKGLINQKLITPTKEKSTRICVEEAIIDGRLQIKSQFFKLDEFNSADTFEIHREKRIFSEQVEQSIINHFIKVKRKLFNDENKIGTTNIKNSAAIKKANEIIKNLNHESSVN